MKGEEARGTAARDYDRKIEEYAARIGRMKGKADVAESRVRWVLGRVERGELTCGSEVVKNATTEDLRSALELLGEIEEG